MRRSVLALLGDILAAGAAIRQYTQGMSEDGYASNQTVRRAVEREFEIIGEALRRLSAGHSDIAAQVSLGSQIIAFRNVLAHGYDVVEDSIVWSIVIKRLPALLSEVERLEAEEKLRP